MVALQLTIGSVFLLISGFWTESFSAIQWTAPFITSLLFISVFVIALGWLVFLRLSVQEKQARSHLILFDSAHINRGQLHFPA